MLKKNDAKPKLSMKKRTNKQIKLTKVRVNYSTT